MPDRNPPATAYQLGVIVHGVSPLIWRRLLVPGGASIAGLHAIVQAAFGWSGEHLHYFTVHGARYGICFDGGPVFRDGAHRVSLASLGLRESERFTYTYNFFADWRLDLRVEQITDARSARCIRGAPAVAAPDRRRIGPGRGTTGSGPSRIWWMRRSCAPRTSSVSC